MIYKLLFEGALSGNRKSLSNEVQRLRRKFAHALHYNLAYEAFVGNLLFGSSATEVTEFSFTVWRCTCKFALLW